MRDWTSAGRNFLISITEDSLLPSLCASTATTIRKSRPSIEAGSIIMEASPFSKISGELRNAIYHEALTHSHGIRLVMHENKLMCTKLPSRLSQTCRAMRNETLKLEFSLNSLTIYTRILEEPIQIDHLVSEMNRWATACGIEQTREVKDITLDFGTISISRRAHEVQWDLLESLRGLFNPEAAIRVVMAVQHPNRDPDDLHCIHFLLGEAVDRIEHLAAVHSGTQKALAMFSAGHLEELKYSEILRFPDNCYTLLDQLPDEKSATSSKFLSS